MKRKHLDQHELKHNTSTQDKEFIQTSYIQYKIGTKKRQCRIPVSSSTTTSPTTTSENTKSSTEPYRQPGIVCRTVCSHLPIMLTTSFWEKFGYTRDEIKTTLRSLMPYHLWQLMLHEGQPIPNGAARPSYADQWSVIYSSRRQACDRLCQVYKTKYAFPIHKEPNHICKTIRQHGEFVYPVVHVNEDDWKQWYSCLRRTSTDPELFQPSNLLCKSVPANFISKPIQWKDTMIWTKQYINNESLLMTRLILWSQYILIYGYPPNIMVFPNLYLFTCPQQGPTLYAEVDEKFIASCICINVTNTQ